jgi:hypothetical protein
LWYQLKQNLVTNLVLQWLIRNSLLQKQFGIFGRKLQNQNFLLSKIHLL